MSTKRDEASPSIDAPENRRWLIGIAISLFFGIFGAVMAWLSYSDRTKAPPATVTPGSKQSANPPTRPRERRRGRD